MSILGINTNTTNTGRHKKINQRSNTHLLAPAQEAGGICCTLNPFKCGSFLYTNKHCGRFGMHECSNQKCLFKTSHERIFKDQTGRFICNSCAVFAAKRNLKDEIALVDGKLPPYTKLKEDQIKCFACWRLDSRHHKAKGPIPQ